MGILLPLDDFGSDIKFVPRNDWGALPAKCKPKAKLELPVHFLHFKETGTASCKGTMECHRVVQDLQAAHDTQGATDIKFNFLVGGYSLIYEGRGWERGAHRDNVLDSPHSVDIAYIGTFTKEEPPSWDMIATAVDFIKYAVMHKYVSPKFLVL